MKELSKADLVIRNARVYNSYFRRFNDADVYVKDGRFLYIDQKKQNEITADNEIDASGRFMIPGLIDIHMHIESSLVTPAAFADYTVSNGLTTIVSEPHEIANVCGKDGIKAMIKDGKDALYDIYYAIPSNVPVMPEKYETAGRAITCQDMLELKDTENVICLGEVMNYMEITQENNSEVGKFIETVRKTDPNYILEGHCPQLKDSDLAKFLYRGINSDHCEHDIEELKQRFENGMFVQIQDLMMKQEVIDFIMENNLYEYFSFVTDDTFPDILIQKGHLDYLVRKAISMGMKPENAIYCATYTPAARMNLRDRGVIAPGRLADFLLLDDINKFIITETYKNGRKVFDITEEKNKNRTYSLGKQYENTVRLEKPDINRFTVHVPGNDRKVKVRVMEIRRNTNVTFPCFVEMEVIDNTLQWQKTDCRLLMVFERHGKNGNIGYGFVKGDGLKEGAVASSLNHDSHDLIVMGCNPQDMKKAVDTIIDISGGIVAVNNGEITGQLSLPIAGLMSNLSVEKAAKQFISIRNAFEKQGYVHRNTVMNLCLLSLTCMPFLKLTDKGYMDTVELRMLPLYEEI